MSDTENPMIRDELWKGPDALGHRETDYGACPICGEDILYYQDIEITDDGAACHAWCRRDE